MIACVGRMLLAVLVLAALQSVALAQVAATEAVTLHGLTFPPLVAGAERFSLREYEKENPGLGYSVGYRQPDAVATVYIYDLKQRDIPDDPSAPAIKAQFAAASADVFRTQQQGVYLKVESRGEFSMADASGRTRLLCAAFWLTRAGGELASYLCVGGWNNKFVKFRITGQQQSQPEAQRFLQAWVELVWPLS
jgi:hypothetical protein